MTAIIRIINGNGNITITKSTVESHHLHPLSPLCSVCGRAGHGFVCKLCGLMLCCGLDFSEVFLSSRLKSALDEYDGWIGTISGYGLFWSGIVLDRALPGRKQWSWTKQKATDWAQGSWTAYLKYGMHILGWYCRWWAVPLKPLLLYTAVWSIVLVKWRKCKLQVKH